MRRFLPLLTCRENSNGKSDLEGRCVPAFAPKVLHNTAQGRAAHPGYRVATIAFYANGVASSGSSGMMQPRRGKWHVDARVSQGALRDPGLRYAAPSVQKNATSWLAVRNKRVHWSLLPPHPQARRTCNGMACQYPVNRHCLFDDLEAAYQAGLAFGREQPEPAPYVVIEVLRRRHRTAS